jgi:predicted transcriptional regulator
MSNTTALRKEVKKYVDKADDRTLKIVHAMLEAEQDYDSWDELPASLKASINRGLKQADKGEVIPHEEVVKKYKKWFTK